MPSLLLLSSITWGLNGCVTIPNISTCSALPRVVNGGGCVHNISSYSSKLSQKEILDLLDAQPADRNCVPAGQILSDDAKTILDPGLPACAEDQSHGIAILLKARGASLIIPPDDFSVFSIAVRKACRELGSSCNYAQIQQMVENVQNMNKASQ